MRASPKTPVELNDNIYYKRDDYFQPFGDYHVNGGKVRQALIMFEKYIDQIKTKYNNGVITAGSVHSPQSANIAKVAEMHEVNCFTCVGGTTEEKLDNHHMMRLTKHYGCEVKIVAGHGMSNVIHSRMRKLAEENGYMVIEQGELLEKNPSEMFYATAEEVDNIPDELDHLVVATGVGVQLMGILIGLKKYNKKVKNIHSICVGPTREKHMKRYEDALLNLYEGMSWDRPSSLELNEFNMIPHKAPYGQGHDVIVNGTYIDDIYEGKAHQWMEKNIDTQNEKTLFWCVGKRPRPEDVDRIINT